MRITGERVSTSAAGFNPTWQRHAAAYALCAQFVSAPVLDLACGIGHGRRWLGSRTVIGLDRDQAALRVATGPSVRGDMRALPFGDRSVASVLAVQSIEHVPDARLVLDEARRVVRAGGPVVLVTPNRLTFGRPDEVIDPYHFVEYSPDDLRALCGARFDSVRLLGLFGSERYLELVRRERRTLDRMLRLDPVHLRRLVPRTMRRVAYDLMLNRYRRDAGPGACEVTVADFELRDQSLEACLDVVAVCR